MFASLRNPRVPASIVLGVIVVAAALYASRPTHIRHVATLFPGPAPLDLIDASEVPEFVRRNHPPTSNTTFHDGWLFSTVRSTVTGKLSSIGLLGTVFDVRSEFERRTDRQAFDAARQPAPFSPAKIALPLTPTGSIHKPNESGASHATIAAGEKIAVR
jgi:hypothetical protein